VRNFALWLEYDGTDFVGSQWQNNGRTVQGALEAAWEQVNQERRRVTLSGRTDAGVHARGQVANVQSETRRDLSTLLKALNAVLPPDVSVLEVREVPQAFHARFSALRRDYRYLIDNGRFAAPLLRNHASHVRTRLNLAAMAQALSALLGQHDFSAFAGGPLEGSPVREMLKAECGTTVELGHELITIDLAANAFLRHMVRNIVGTLLWVGEGRVAASEMTAILHGRDRRRAGPTAPPHGLYLMAVTYPAGMVERRRSAGPATDAVRSEEESA
jgi:tRNA pseudouridine38-40 synthase